MHRMQQQGVARWTTTMLMKMMMIWLTLQEAIGIHTMKTSRDLMKIKLKRCVSPKKYTRNSTTTVIPCFCNNISKMKMMKLEEVKIVTIISKTTPISSSISSKLLESLPLHSISQKKKQRKEIITILVTMEAVMWLSNMLTRCINIS